MNKYNGKYSVTFWVGWIILYPLRLFFCILVSIIFLATLPKYFNWFAEGPDQ